MHPRLKLALDASGFLAKAVAAGTKRVALEVRRPRDGAYSSRRPGAETPYWNALATALEIELSRWGAIARCAAPAVE